MVDEIKKRDREYGLSRVAAGYAWPWNSRSDSNAFDIYIDDAKYKWNRTNSDWINSPSAIDEIGCIHTTQGYDLNYVGVIFGTEIGYDAESKKIFIRSENYFDINGKQSITSEDQLTEYVINIYKTLMLRGIRGTYIYVCDEKLRNYFANFLPVKEQTSTPNDNVQFEDQSFEDGIPFYDLEAAAGVFSDEQSIKSTKWLRIPQDMRFSSDLFACIVVGESMNRVISNGSICIFTRDRGGSREGKIVLVECTELQSEFGSQYTIKEYHSKKIENADHFSHAEIILKPLSTDPAFQSIYLQDNEQSNFKIVGVFQRLL